MAELMLAKELRLALKAQAHALDPVVLLGAAGLSTAVLVEIDRALNAHGLIKVRVPMDDRAERESVFEDIAVRLGAGRVQAIGKLIVLYRPPPPEEPSESKEQSERSRQPRPRAKQSQKRQRRQT